MSAKPEEKKLTSPELVTKLVAIAYSHGIASPKTEAAALDVCNRINWAEDEVSRLVGAGLSRAAEIVALRKERDALAARVKELEAQLGEGK